MFDTAPLILLENYELRVVYLAQLSSPDSLSDFVAEGDSL
jgi:hypothetical protein